MTYPIVTLNDIKHARRELDREEWKLRMLKAFENEHGDRYLFRRIENQYGGTFDRVEVLSELDGAKHAGIMFGTRIESAKRGTICLAAIISGDICSEVHETSNANADIRRASVKLRTALAEGRAKGKNNDLG